MIFLILGSLACSSSKSSDSASAVDSAQSVDTSDTSDTSDTGGFPSDPTPFTLEVSGVLTESLLFDEPSCLKPTGSSNLRIFWRNSQGQHVFVLKVEMLGTYSGTGQYGTEAARATLQEEAGGSGLYFTLDGDAGDTLTVDIVGDDGNQIWGSAEMSGMHDASGAAITFDPTSIPVWCPEITE